MTIFPCFGQVGFKIIPGQIQCPQKELSVRKGSDLNGTLDREAPTMQLDPLNFVERIGCHVALTAAPFLPQLSHVIVSQGLQETSDLIVVPVQDILNEVARTMVDHTQVDVDAKLKILCTQMGNLQPSEPRVAVHGTLELLDRLQKLSRLILGKTASRLQE